MQLDIEPECILIQNSVDATISASELKAKYLAFLKVKEIEVEAKKLEVEEKEKLMDAMKKEVEAKKLEVELKKEEAHKIRQRIAEGF